MLVFYIIGFNGMISPYSWLLGGEIPSQRLRSMTVGFASATSFFFAWLSTFTAPYFINPDSLNWGPKYGYIWTGSCMACAIWSFLFLPETFNRSFEEISEMVSHTLHRIYVCDFSRKPCSDQDYTCSSKHASRLENFVTRICPILGRTTPEKRVME